jgi:signal peptidase I
VNIGLGLSATEDGNAALQSVQSQRTDPFELGRYTFEQREKAAPDDAQVQSGYSYYNLGWYVPGDRILPMGDNRDNSQDGRYFGPVHQDKVLGRAMIKYWPITRFGLIR